MKKKIAIISAIVLSFGVGMGTLSIYQTLSNPIDITKILETNTGYTIEHIPLETEIPQVDNSTNETIIENTNNSSAAKITVDETIKGFQSRANALIQDVDNVKKGQTYSDNVKIYRDLDYKINILDNDMDYYEDKIEMDHRNNTMDYNTFIQKYREIETVEYSIENLDDILEYKLGIYD